MNIKEVIVRFLVGNNAIDDVYHSNDFDAIEAFTENDSLNIIAKKDGITLANSYNTQYVISVHTSALD